MGFLVRDFEEYLQNDTHFIFDDFQWYTTAHLFTTTASNSGTVAVSDGVSGIVKIDPSDATQADNDETYLHQTAETFKFATDKPMFFAAKVRPVANTIANINVIVGLKDAWAADSITDDGAGPASSYSGAIFFKEDGGTDWHVESSISTSQTTVATAKTVGNNAWDILAIKTNPISSTVTEVHFFFADVQTDGDFTLTEVGKTTSGEQFVAHTITHTNATDMEVGFGCKNGVANDTQYLDVDWVYCAQRR